MRNALLALMLLGVVAVTAAADDKKDRRDRDEGIGATAFRLGAETAAHVMNDECFAKRRSLK